MSKHSYHLPVLAENLRKAREFRGISIRVLAKRIGVSEPHWSRIERGLNVPSAALVADAARYLTVNIGELFGTDAFSGSLVHYRGKAVLKENFSRQVEEIVHLYEALETLCGVARYRAFPLDIPVRERTSRDIEEAAQMARELFGIRYAIVFDWFELFESNGLRIVLMRLPRAVDGFSYGSFTTGTVTFFVNTLSTPERKIFTLAHELGHLVFHQGQVKYGAPQVAHSGSTNEDAVNAFAAAFLMPETAVRRAVSQTGLQKNIWSLELLLQMKAQFGVSAESFLRRLADLDLISQPLFGRILRSIHAYYKKHRNSEPGESRIALNTNHRLIQLLLSCPLRGVRVTRRGTKIRSRLRELQVII